MRWTAFYILLSIGFCPLLNSCNQVLNTVAEPSLSALPDRSTKQTILWAGKLDKNTWQKQWGVQDKGSWGLENLTVIPDPEKKFAQIMRVRFPKGSASPAASRKEDAPLGGTQFYADLKLPAQNALRLSYYVRFSKDFDFVKGGKLPGLYGGTGNSGGDIPDGTDGFSTRFMWRRHGDGEVYAYLPNSKKYGTSIGRGDWQFQRGVWHHIEQEVVLNQPNQRNGQIRVWFDDKSVLLKRGLSFRSVDSLKLDGLFFSTFFGGNDTSWATPKDVFIDFAEFSVSSVTK